MLKVPLIFFLASVALCKLLSQKLMKCDRLREAREVFESRQVRSASMLLNEIKSLRSKYFHKGSGFIEEIKQAFEEKPFDSVLKVYYKKVGESEETEKKQKITYKRELAAKLQEYVSSEQALQLLTRKAEERKYVLHIYFYVLPECEGKMVLVSGKNEFESLGQGSRYFIIGELDSAICLKYTDFKGRTYSGELTFVQGFNEFKVKIYTEKREQFETVHYLAGLLTENQIEMIKSNKRFSHFMGPNITVELFRDEFLKPLREARYGGGQEWMAEAWFRDLLMMFSHGNKLFN